MGRPRPPSRSAVGRPFGGEQQLPRERERKCIAERLSRWLAPSLAVTAERQPPRPWPSPRQLRLCGPGRFRSDPRAGQRHENVEDRGGYREAGRTQRVDSQVKLRALRPAVYPAEARHWFSGAIAPAPAQIAVTPAAALLRTALA